MGITSPPEHRDMTPERMEAVVTDLLHWPCADILPDAAVNALSVWLLKRRHILPSAPCEDLPWIPGLGIAEPSQNMARSS